MENKELQKIFKDALDEIKQKTVMDLMEKDVSYNKSVDRHARAEERYMSIVDSLKKEDKEIIDELIVSNEVNFLDACDLFYLAGIKDTLQLLNSYELLKNNLKNIEPKP